MNLIGRGNMDGGLVSGVLMRWERRSSPVRGSLAANCLTFLRARSLGVWVVPEANGLYLQKELRLGA